MKTKILFIHGAGKGAHTEDQKLVDDLHSKLSEGYEIVYPQMPDEHAPDYLPWKKAILNTLTNIPGEIILAGHSLGGSVLLKCLSEEKVSNHIVGIFLLAAPFWGGDSDWQSEDYTLSDDFTSHIPSSPIFLYHNSDDGIVPVSHLGMYSKKIPEAHVCKREVGGHQFENGVQDIANDIQKL